MYLKTYNYRCHNYLRNIYYIPFESKHQYFKRTQRNSSTFINVTYSFSKRHQQLLAHHMSDICTDETNLLVDKLSTSLPIDFIDMICEKCNLLNSPTYFSMCRSGDLT